MKIGAPGSNTLGNVREQRLKNDYFLIKKRKKRIKDHIVYIHIFIESHFV